MLRDEDKEPQEWLERAMWKECSTGALVARGTGYGNGLQMWGSSHPAGRIVEHLVGCLQNRERFVRNIS